MTWIVCGLLGLVAFEMALTLVVRRARLSFPWLITEQDELPDLDQAAVEKFINGSFDVRLGWVRKPKSMGTEQGRNGEVSYSINSLGSRVNSFNSGAACIAAFGDSYAFCRQVENDETWEAHLAQETGCAVLNFGVGNYGVDQALLRYEEAPLPNSIRVVLMAFVPETICRVQSYWKHYLEFGNTFAFKPRFALDSEGTLELLENPIKGAADFENLEAILPHVQAKDEFYERKFRAMQFRFPYTLTLLRKPGRHLPLLAIVMLRGILRSLGKKFTTLENLPFALVMKDNTRQSHRQYRGRYSTELLREILLRFKTTAIERGHIPAVVVIPQLSDLKLMDLDGPAYQGFYRELETELAILDLTKQFVREDVADLYTNDQYGGHLSPEGNQLVASEVGAWINDLEQKNGVA